LFPTRQVLQDMVNTAVVEAEEDQEGAYMHKL